jgi:hypothetical protein
MLLSAISRVISSIMRLCRMLSKDKKETTTDYPSTSPVGGSVFTTRQRGVPEVWFWEDSSLRFHLLRGGAYIPSPRSARLADLEPTLIARFMAGGTQSQAVKEIRAALRDEKGTGASQ